MCKNLPHDYLYHLPRLEHLTVQSYNLRGLPSGFLDWSPHLRTLTIEFEAFNKYAPPEYRTEELPRRLLANTPRLEHLYIEGGELKSETLPDDLLLYTSELREIHLDPGIALARIPPNVAAQLRAASPSLTVTPASLKEGQELVFANLAELKLHVGGLSPTGTERCFAPGTTLRFPNLTELTLSLRGRPKNTSTCVVPDLVYPELRRLELLDGSDSEHLVHALQHAPQLTHLLLYAWTLPPSALPPSLFADNPLLETLKIVLREPTVLPNDFLAYTPNLVSLSVKNGNFIDLPPWWLRRVPKLQTLHIYDPSRTSFPTDFLDHTGNLRHLELYTYQVATLPDNFLRNAPNLKHVRLHALELASLPEDFLSDAPNLEFVDVRGVFTELPERFLAGSPQIIKVSVGGYPLAEWLQIHQNR